MLQQIADFKAEVEDLNALLMTLSETDWTKETLFKSWTVNNVVQHLHGGDLMAAASAAGPDAFARHRAESQALRDSGLSRLEATRRQMVDLTGFRLHRAWYAQVLALCEKLAAMPAEARLKWSGPDMGLRMFATARQMETWAHGQEIFDVMGAERRPTDRLRNIAEIGVRTYGWTFANRGLAAPGPAPHVRLTAPSGAVWTWNDPASDNCIEGFALEFCQVVTQVRNITDTALTVTGTPARDWMRVAQCFAGPPEDPPAPGSRYANRREA